MHLDISTTHGGQTQTRPEPVRHTHIHTATRIHSSSSSHRPRSTSNYPCFLLFPGSWSWRRGTSKNNLKSQNAKLKLKLNTKDVKRTNEADKLYISIRIIQYMMYLLY